MKMTALYRQLPKNKVSYLHIITYNRAKKRKEAEMPVSLVTEDIQLQTSPISLIRTFIMCDSCFWCASGLRKVELTNCPVCNKETLSSLPVARNEKYSYSYSEKRGVEVTFSSIKE
jgi:hypothetical protein